MIKDDLNSALREYVKKALSPSAEDRTFVSLVYSSFKEILPDSFQVGSYKRFTAVRPLHDLDILVRLGAWDDANHELQDCFADIQKRLREQYNNPTRFQLKVVQQSHSITVKFLLEGTEHFSVDLVPAYSISNNEFGAPFFKVPEILLARHGERRELIYEQVKAKQRGEIKWIKSDPHGYIEVAQRLNDANSDFRLAVKFAKSWKNNCDGKFPHFKLKSFHIEQLITNHFASHPGISIFDAIFGFFMVLPDAMQRAAIPDRADSQICIDEYVNSLTQEQRDAVRAARDGFLVKLENIVNDQDVSALLEPFRHIRASGSEQFLFDFRIPVLTDPRYRLIVGAKTLPANGFRDYVLDRIGLVPYGRSVEFSVIGCTPAADYFKWKVKNDDKSPDPRGEITDHFTKNRRELAKYQGDHHAECYAIKDGVCVAKARQNVKLD